MLPSRKYLTLHFISDQHIPQHTACCSVLCPLLLYHLIHSFWQLQNQEMKAGPFLSDSFNLCAVSGMARDEFNKLQL